jgi:hypothetical protein
MAGFEFGEELIVLKKLDVGSTRYKPGDDFEYEELELDFVEKLLGQRVLIRKALVSQRLMGQLKSSKVAKIIKNVKGVRMAISWPSDEDLPEGVLDYRFSKNDALQADLKEGIEEQEPPAKKKVKTPRRRAKTTLKKDFE